MMNRQCFLFMSSMAGSTVPLMGCHRIYRDVIVADDAAKYCHRATCSNKKVSFCCQRSVKRVGHLTAALWDVAAMWVATEMKIQFNFYLYSVHYKTNCL